MTEAVFVAEPTRLLIAATVGIILLLLLIIKIKIHPVIITADLSTGYWTWSRNAGSNTGKHSSKGCRRDFAGNRVADRSWILYLEESWKCPEVHSVLHRHL